MSLSLVLSMIRDWIQPSVLSKKKKKKKKKKKTIRGQIWNFTAGLFVWSIYLLSFQKHLLPFRRPLYHPLLGFYNYLFMTCLWSLPCKVLSRDNKIISEWYHFWSHFNYVLRRAVDTRNRPEYDVFWLKWLQTVLFSYFTCFLRYILCR